MPNQGGKCVTAVTCKVYCMRGLSNGMTWKLSGSPGTLSISIRLEHCKHTMGG